MPDPAQQAAIMRMWRLRKRGKSLMAIRDAVRKSGVAISHETVRLVLQRPVLSLLMIGVALAALVSVDPALAGSNLANPAVAGLVTGSEASTGTYCDDIQFVRLCGTPAQWRAFAQDACYRADGHGGSMAQCFEAGMAFGRAGEAGRGWQR